MKMMMPYTHSFNIAVVTTCPISCLLLFYRDASVPYSRTCRRDSYSTLVFVFDS